MKQKKLSLIGLVLCLNGCSSSSCISGSTNSAGSVKADSESDKTNSESSLVEAGPVFLPYEIDKTGCINRFYANESNSENVVIPATYSIDSEGRIVSGTAYQIKEISDFCFANNALTKTITIPDTVEVIGKSAFFNCQNLEKINLPSAVTSLGKDAFEKCPKLTLLSGSDGEMGFIVSENDNFYVFDIPTSIATIDNQAFVGWDKLSSLTIGENVKKISGSSIRNCPAITSVTVKGTLSSLGTTVFSGCPNLTTITFEKAQAVKQYTVPVSVTSLPENAFYDWTSLETVTIHKGVVMHSNIFKNNYSLKTVKCPNTSFLDLFYSHSASYEVEEDYRMYTSRRSRDSSGPRYYYVPKTLIDVEFYDNNNTDTIESGCFMGMESLTSITLPTGINMFGNGSFYKLPNLQNVYFSTTHDWEYFCTGYVSDYGTISVSTMNSPEALASAIKEHFTNSSYYWCATNA